MVDYSSALLKLQRAETHLGELDYLVFRYLRKHAYRVRMESDFGANKFGYYISLVETPPPTIPAVIGDTVHNLRATLDYLISACALANGKTANDTAFPTAVDRIDLERRLKDKARKAGGAAMQIVRDLRPYPGGIDALVDLHKLDLVDKHRAVLAVAGAGDFRYRHIPRNDQPQLIVEDRVYLLGNEEQFIPAAEGRESERPFEVGLTIDVVFPSDGPFGNIPCVKALAETLDLVRSIVRQFQEKIP